MSHAERVPFLVCFERKSPHLRVQVIGESTLENTLAYWRAIAEEMHSEPADSILLVDELQGEPLGQHEWLGLVEQMQGRGLERARIAHVRPHGLELIEYCEIFAREAGFNARVFDDEHAAGLWLRYGET